MKLTAEVIVRWLRPSVLDLLLFSWPENFHVGASDGECIGLCVKTLRGGKTCISVAC